MAVLGRLLISSAERLDLPDLLSIDSYAAGDWKYFLKSLVGDSRPYVLKGFDVIDPQNAIGSESCSIRVADSVVYYPNSNAGSFFYGLEEGNAQAAPLVPELRKNTVNYVYLTLSTFNTSTDTRAFWDPDKDGGAGGEFTQDINTESVLKVEVNVSTGSFPQNTIPIAKITVGSSVITLIEDARDMMFRLGSGGLAPNPYNEFAWRSNPSSVYKRTEPPTLMQSGGVNAFQGADKNIYTLKEWMDVVMTRVRELAGTTYWYEDTSTFGVVTNFFDAVGTTFKSKGKWLHDSSTPGQLTWTEDIQIKMTADPRTYIIRGTGTKALNNEQVMYVPLVRRQDISATNEAVSWTNGQPYVNTVGGAVGLFANLKKGDWIKKINDSFDKWLRVEEFYTEIGSLTTTIPANAKSIKLSGNYLGTTANEKAKYDCGEYLTSDVLVADRNNINIYNTGGNFHWLAMRSDTIQNIDSIAKTNLSLTITDHDGATAKITSGAAHGLIDGDRITIAGTANFDGEYVVEVESTTVFYIGKSGGPYADDSGTGHYAVVTTASRSSVDGFLEESDKHNFKTNDTVLIQSTTGYNGSKSVSVRSPTTFNIAADVSATSQPTAGTVTLPRVIVRTEGSVYELVQGENVDIGGSSADNMRQYIGMDSLSQVAPIYNVPVAYNTLDGMANYNSSTSDNLTNRVSKLTAMMADKAQDKTITFLPSWYESVTNTTNGLYQDIVFNSVTPPPRLDIAMPGSDYNYGTVLLSGTLSLQANQVAYVQVDRNATFNYANLSALSVSNIVDLSIDENIFVVALRLGTNEIWLWDGFYVPGDSTVPTLNYLDLVVQQNRMMKLVGGGLWSWDLLNEQLTISSSANIAVPDLPLNRNEILAQTITLANSGEVAYVDINRSPGAAATLTVSVADMASLVPDADRVIIAYRDGNDVDVGIGTMRLAHGETKALDADDKTVKVRTIDISSTSLPTGATVTVDGISLANGDKVLFTQSGILGVYMVSGIGTSATWTKLDVFGGNSSPDEGSLVSVQDGTAGFNTLWSFFGNAWKQADHSEVIKEPTGFPNRTDTVIGFNDGTREFSLTPAGASFDIYQRGKPYRFTAAQTIAITDTEGLHYIYFNNGSLVSTQTFSDAIITEYVVVATVQWNVADQVHIMLSDERHGLTMDGTTHQYLHTAIGARYISGLSADNFTLGGTGANDSDAQISISNGVIRDEDIRIAIVDDPAPAAPFEQVLDPIAEIPVYYRSGASGAWRKEAATQFPISYVGAGQPRFNNPSGPWTRDLVQDGYYYAMWIFATNNQEAPIVAVVGQREDTSLTDAQANNRYETLSFGDLPSAEMKVLYRLIFKYDSTYTNAVKSTLEEVNDLRRSIDVSLGTYAPGDHGLLTGLTDQDHPASAIFTNPATFDGTLSVADDDVQKALETIDKYFATLQLREHPTDKKRVIVTGSDKLKTDGTLLSQQIQSLIVDFDGAEIDFQTGSIYKSDGITALGINFTPATIALNQWRWHSVQCIASTVGVDNRISLQMLVLPADIDGASQSAASRAPFGTGIKLGQVAVQQGAVTINNITQSQITQLAVGSGGAGEGTGDANALLESLKNQFENSYFELLTPNIFTMDEDDLVDVSATGSFSLVDKTFKLNTGETFVSTNMLDPNEFLADSTALEEVELSTYWNLADIDTAATYEVTRNGSSLSPDWQTVTVERVGNTDLYRGYHTFAQEPVDESFYSTVATATTPLTLDNANNQAFGQQFALTSKKGILRSIELRGLRVGTPDGNLYVAIHEDNGGVPGARICMSDPKPTASLNLNVSALFTVNMPEVYLLDGVNYHVVVTTDAAYKATYDFYGNKFIQVHGDTAAAPYIDLYNGTSWSAFPGYRLYANLKGIDLDLRVRITASTASKLKGYGIFYSKVLPANVASGSINSQVFEFSGGANTYEFTLTKFTPNADLLKVYDVNTGQVYVYGSFSLDGQKVIFSSGQFYSPGQTIRLNFMQVEGSVFDSADVNGLLLASNHLGSTDASIDRSIAGRGIFLRRPDGTLREITIDDNDQIVIYSV